jgi:hypothetical protein
MRLIPALLKNTSTALSKKRDRERERQINGRTAWLV